MLHIYNDYQYLDIQYYRGMNMQLQGKYKELKIISQLSHCIKFNHYSNFLCATA